MSDREEMELIDWMAKSMCEAEHGVGTWDDAYAERRFRWHARAKAAYVLLSSRGWKRSPTAQPPHTSNGG